MRKGAREGGSKSEVAWAPDFEGTPSGMPTGRAASHRKAHWDLLRNVIIAASTSRLLKRPRSEPPKRCHFAPDEPLPSLHVRGGRAGARQISLLNPHAHLTKTNRRRDSHCTSRRSRRARRKCDRAQRLRRPRPTEVGRPRASQPRRPSSIATSS